MPFLKKYGIPLPDVELKVMEVVARTLGDKRSESGQDEGPCTPSGLVQRSNERRYLISSASRFGSICFGWPGRGSACSEAVAGGVAEEHLCIDSSRVSSDEYPTVGPRKPVSTYLVY